jgi:hypothetical protein
MANAIIKITVVTIFVFFVVTGCKNTDNQNINTSLDTLSFDYREYKLDSGKIEIELSYPVFKTVDSISLKLNALLENQLFPNYSSHFAHNITLLKDSLKKLANTFPSNKESTRISYIRKIAIIHQNSEYVSFKLSGYDYTGGAHGNPFSQGLVFDKSEMIFLQLSDVLDTNHLKEVTQLLLNELKSQSSIPLDSNIENQGFLISDELFFTSTNFFLKEEGLAFIYNPYEIAPYSSGATYLLLKYNQLKSWILLKEFAQ